MKKTASFILSLFLMICTVYAIDKKVVEEWARTMSYGISSQRLGVIKSIEDNKASDAYYLIEQAMTNDINDTVRGQAVYSMVALKLASENVWLAALSAETNSEVLRKIAFGISELKLMNAGQKLVALLNSRISNVKDNILSATIVRTLGDIEYKPAEGPLMGLLTNMEYSVEIRSSAAIALGNLSDAGLIPVLLNILNNPGEVREVRMYCAYAIGRTGDAKAVDILTPYVENESEDHSIRLWSIAGLSHVKSSQVFPKLVEFAKMDDIRIRTESIKALGKFTNSLSIELLTFKALFDPEISVRREAKNSLQGLGIDVDKLGITTNTNITITYVNNQVIVRTNNPVNVQTTTNKTTATNKGK